MKQRLLVAAVGVPLLIVVLVILPPWGALVLTALICAIAAYELLKTAGENTPYTVYAMTMVLAAIQAIYIVKQSDVFSIGPVSSVTMIRWYFVILMFTLAVVGYGRGSRLTFKTLCVAVVGGMVFPAMYSCIGLLRWQEEFGQVYVLMPFVIAFIGDSFSMFGGMIFGGPKMAPHVSPKKTWAGAAAGPVGSALGMMLLGLVSHAIWGYAPRYGMLALCGAVSNVFGQLGDLSMSLVKREVGIKDYSRLFLTHGGMLDRFDSTMFIAPLVYFFVAGGVL